MMGMMERLKALVGLLPAQVQPGSECSVFGKHKPIAIRRGYPQVMCKCGALGVRSLKIGANSITMSPAGVGDVIRWSATQNAVAAGDIGMDVSTGVPNAFINGAVANILSTENNLQSVFEFTHTTGAASTGALGFTPRFAIYVGAMEVAASNIVLASGLIIGTGLAAKAASLLLASGGQTVSGDGSAAAGYSGNGGGQVFSSGMSNDLDVTVFDATGVELTWAAPITGSHAGKLLVVG